MDVFLKFNRKSIQDRQIDTLIGLSKGLLADGKIDQSEAEFLKTWLIQNASVTTNPILLYLLDRVTTMLEDGCLDTEESAELFSILQRFAGEPSAMGEVAKPTALPLDDPKPSISFPGNTFLITGTCAFGTRKKCQTVIESLGGVNAKGVTKSLNYLIIGSYVTDSWIHESFGRKIEKAMEYRSDGIPLQIVSEEHWLIEAGC